MVRQRRSHAAPRLARQELVGRQRLLADELARGGSTAEEACPAGSTSGRGAKSCEACAPATYAAEASATRCVSSAAGYFVEASGATGQDPCAAGSASGAESEACDATVTARPSTSTSRSYLA